MNIEKMNKAMVEMEEKAQGALGTPEWAALQGKCEGFRTAMSLLGYSWYGRFRGGFRRERER